MELETEEERASTSLRYVEAQDTPATRLLSQLPPGYEYGVQSVFWYSDDSYEAKIHTKIPDENAWNKWKHEYFKITMQNLVHYNTNKKLCRLIFNGRYRCERAGRKRGPTAETMGCNESVLTVTIKDPLLLNSSLPFECSNFNTEIGMKIKHNHPPLDALPKPDLSQPVSNYASSISRPTNKKQKVVTNVGNAEFESSMGGRKRLVPYCVVRHCSNNNHKRLNLKRRKPCLNPAACHETHKCNNCSAVFDLFQMPSDPDERERWASGLDVDVERMNFSTMIPSVCSFHKISMDQRGCDVAADFELKTTDPVLEAIERDKLEKKRELEGRCFICRESCTDKGHFEWLDGNIPELCRRTLSESEVCLFSKLIICCDHFRDEDICFEDGITMNLKPDAVPIFQTKAHKCSDYLDRSVREEPASTSGASSDAIISASCVQSEREDESDEYGNKVQSHHPSISLWVEGQVHTALHVHDYISRNAPNVVKQPELHLNMPTIASNDGSQKKGPVLPVMGKNFILEGIDGLKRIHDFCMSAITVEPMKEEPDKAETINSNDHLFDTNPLVLNTFELPLNVTEIKQELVDS